MKSAAVATVDTVAGPFTIVVANDVVIAEWVDESVDEVLEPVAESPTRVDRRGAPARRDHSGGSSLQRRRPHCDRRHRGGTSIQGRSSRPCGICSPTPVPPGAPITYVEFVGKVVAPDAVRAAASACARNSAALFVPCHRVVRTGGGLGESGWGLEIKQRLL